MAEIVTDPVRLGLLPRDPAGDRRGPRPVRRRHVHLQGRAPAGRLAAEPRRRGRDRPEDRRDRLALPGRRPALRPHGDVPRRHAGRRLGLDRQRGARPRHPRRARRSAGSPPATRRTRTTTPPTASGSTTPASAWSTRPPTEPPFDSTKGDRRFQIVDASTNEIIEQIDMGQKLAEAGYPDMSSAVRPMAISARRALRLLPGLVLPRVRRVRLRRRTGSRASRTCRTRSRRCRASSTCSTPRTTASR